MPAQIPILNFEDVICAEIMSSADENYLCHAHLRDGFEFMAVARPKGGFQFDSQCQTKAVS